MSTTRAQFQVPREDKQKKYLSDKELDILRQQKKSKNVQTPSALQPMTIPLDQGKQTTSSPIDLKKNHVTKLENGATVASQESYSSAAAFCVFFDHGVMDETDETHGFCHLIERLAYRVKHESSNVFADDRNKIFERDCRTSRIIWGEFSIFKLARNCNIFRRSIKVF